MSAAIPTTDATGHAAAPVRVWVGADRSQALAARVLEYSIRRHSSLPVQVEHMIDLPVPEPRDPARRQRTGFSFSRFCIPALAGRRGRGIYMDADMLVFADVRELWELPFDGGTVLIQREVAHGRETVAKRHAPARRRVQCSVMVLDCAALPWDVERIVAGLDEDAYDYEQLMDELCIVPREDLRAVVPPEWNSLEYWDEDTRLLHYTDMGTQPWVSNRNALGHLWYAEVRRMLDDGSLRWSELEDEVAAGHFRPSLLADLRHAQRLPRWFLPAWNRWHRFRDHRSGFRKHRRANEARKARLAALAAD